MAIWLPVAAIAVVAAVLLFPAIESVPDRLIRACAGWLALAGGLELLSAAGYVAVFALTFCAGMAWRSSSRIACTSLAAGAVLPAGGLVGPGLGAAYARSRGTPTPGIAARVTAFLLLTSVPNLLVIALLGLALWSGVLPGPRSPLLTALPAAIAIGLLVLFVVVSACSARLREAKAPARRYGPIAAGRALAAGAREAVTLVEGHNWRLLGAVANYGFDNAALWASFRAVGHSPAASVIVMAFLVGGLGNALPLPAGVGRTEVGLFGSLLLYGVAAAPAALAVFVYRVASTGVPLLLGALAVRGLHLRGRDGGGSRSARTAGHGVRHHVRAAVRAGTARPPRSPTVPRRAS